MTIFRVQMQDYNFVLVQKSGTESYIHAMNELFDKEGTEGAAATGVELVLLSGFHGQFLDLTLNKPFIFIVEDVENNIPILVGRVKNPLM